MVKKYKAIWSSASIRQILIQKLDDAQNTISLCFCGWRRNKKKFGSKNQEIVSLIGGFPLKAGPLERVATAGSYEEKRVTAKRSQY